MNKLSAHTRLTPEEEDAVLNLQGTMVAVNDRATLVRRGEEVTASCIVLEGMIARVGQTKTGNVQFAALHVPGDMPDIYALLMPYSLMALEAVCPSTVLRIPRTVMRDIVLKYPGVAEAFWRETMVDASISNEWLVNIGQRPGKERVAHLICEIAYRVVEQPSGSFAFSFPLNQEQLGATTGMSSVHVNRVLHDLRKEGAVRLHRAQATIEDWNKLKAIAGFDPNYLLTSSVQRMMPS